MNKKAIILILFVIFEIYSIAQTFEGKITYWGVYGSHNVERYFFIQGDKYRSEMNLNNLELPVYILYNGSFCYYISDIYQNISKDTSNINARYKIRKTKKEETILGYKCSVYRSIRNTDFGKDTLLLYVADSLKTGIDEQTGISYSGKIILKQVQLKNGKKYVSQAVEIKKEQFSDELFELPDYPVEEVDMRKMAGKYSFKTD